MTKLERLFKAVQDAETILEECSSDYNAPNFTDRHRTGPRIDAVLDELRDAMKKFKK